MAVTIFEALQNANYNLKDNTTGFGTMLAHQQLNNAVVLLEKGYDMEDLVDPLLEKYGEVENVPGKED